MLQQETAGTLSTVLSLVKTYWRTSKSGLLFPQLANDSTDDQTQSRAYSAAQITAFGTSDNRTDNSADKDPYKHENAVPFYEVGG